MPAALSALPSPLPRALRRRLLVVERGAASFTAGAGYADFDETIAIGQHDDEPAAELADRVLLRIAAAERSGRCFDAASVFVGATTDPDSSAARRLIALGIAAHAKSSPHLAELVVVASVDAEPEARDQLLELTHDLVVSAEGPPLAARVCFVPTLSAAALSRARPAVTKGIAPVRSGTHHRPPSRTPDEEATPRAS